LRGLGKWAEDLGAGASADHVCGVYKTLVRPTDCRAGPDGSAVAL